MIGADRFHEVAVKTVLREFARSLGTVWPDTSGAMQSADVNGDSLWSPAELEVVLSAVVKPHIADPLKWPALMRDSLRGCVVWP